MSSVHEHYENRDKLNDIHKYVQAHVDSYRLLTNIRVNGKMIMKGTYVHAPAAKRAGLDKMPTVAVPCDQLGRPIGTALIADAPPQEITETNTEIRKFGTSKFNKMHRFNMPTEEHIRMASKEAPFVPPEPPIDIYMPVEGATAPSVEVVDDLMTVETPAPAPIVETAPPVTATLSDLQPQQGRKARRAARAAEAAVAPAAPVADPTPAIVPAIPDAINEPPIDAAFI